MTYAQIARHSRVMGIAQWRTHYNEVRPHSSLGYRTPAEFKASCLTERPVGTILQ